MHLRNRLKFFIDVHEVQRAMTKLAYACDGLFCILMATSVMVALYARSFGGMCNFVDLGTGLSLSDWVLGMGLSTMFFSAILMIANCSPHAFAATDSANAAAVAAAENDLNGNLNNGGYEASGPNGLNSGEIEVIGWFDRMTVLCSGGRLGRYIRRFSCPRWLVLTFLGASFLFGWIWWGIGAAVIWRGNAACFSGAGPIPTTVPSNSPGPVVGSGGALIGFAVTDWVVLLVLLFMSTIAIVRSLCAMRKRTVHAPVHLDEASTDIP